MRCETNAFKLCWANLHSLQEGDLDPDTTEMWFAGKKMQRDKTLQDYAGSNEKTRVVVKLQEAGAIKPSREPV